MTQRIYSLAKELKLDSKELLAICQELNLGKPSALASLDAEEVALVKEHLKRGRGGKAHSSAVATAPEGGPATSFRREDYIPPTGAKTGKVPVIERRPGRTSTSAGTKVAEAPTAEQDASTEYQPSAVAVPTAPSPESPPIAAVGPSLETPETPQSLEVMSAVPHAPVATPAVETAEGTAQGAVAPEDVSAEVSLAGLEMPPYLGVPEQAAPVAAEDSGVPLPPLVAPTESVIEPSAPVFERSELPVEALETPPSAEEEGKTSGIPAAPVSSGSGQGAPTLPSGAEIPPVTVAQGFAQDTQDTIEASSPELPTAPQPTAAEGEAPRRPPVTDAERLAAIRPIPELPRSRRGGTSTSGGQEAAQKAERKKPRSKAEPPRPRLVRLAPMPTPRPAPVPRHAEPAAQKPEIRLTSDAIRASRMGAMPLADHLRQQEEKRKGKKKEKEGGKEGAVLPVLPRRKGRHKEDEHETPEQVAAKAKRKKEVVRIKEDEEVEVETTKVQPTRLRRTRSVSTAAPRKSSVVLELPCTVRSFAEALGLSAQKILAKLFEMGTMANINSTLDDETAGLLAAELGAEVTFKSAVDPQEKIEAFWNAPDPEEKLQPRPPVVTFLGHVDHGKTSLLDKILDLNVAAKEKGGITQHIRAYQVVKNGRPITFLDTPGHEAFTAMRARGANCTDIVVLVVAADDGVMPQTEEAINHAKAAGVPIVVAINKIDLPGTRPERVMQQLTGLGLVPTEWGGNVEVIRTSALTGEGIADLLDTLITLGDLYELKANYDRPACGTCLEASLQTGRGVTAKFLVQKGTLRTGDIVVCDVGHGRIKAMYDPLQPRRRVTEATPGTPVDVIGLNQVPEAGSRFVVLEDIAEARKIAEHRSESLRRREMAESQGHVTLENLLERLSEKEKKTLYIILRADTRGSIEAILKEISKLEHLEVKIQVLQALVGGITAADVQLADASDAVIIGFNVVPDEDARALAEQLKVQIRRYDIIYQVSEDLKAALEGLLQPEKREVDLGRALVQRVFHISRIGNVAGCRVLSGTITRDARVRVIREQRIIGEYPLESLKREKDDVREVREGFECGIKLAGFDDIKEGDILEAYRIEEVRRTLESATQTVG